MSYKSFSFSLLGIAIGAFMTGALQFVVAWNAPATLPPTPNVAAPINVSATTQIKTGPLMANLPLNTTLFSGAGLQVGGVAYVGSLTSVGQIKIGNTTLSCTVTNAGAIRWTGATFEGCNGINWIPFGTMSTNPGLDLVFGLHSSVQCTALGGVVMLDGTDKFCKFSGASCPIGWSTFKNWSATSPKSQNATVLTKCGGGADAYCQDNATGVELICTTGSHAFSNASLETCSRNVNVGSCVLCLAAGPFELYQLMTVYSSKIEVGCY